MVLLYDRPARLTGAPSSPDDRGMSRHHGPNATGAGNQPHRASRPDPAHVHPIGPPLPRFVPPRVLPAVGASAGEAAAPPGELMPRTKAGRGSPPKINRSRTENALPGVPVGPPLRWTRPAEIPAGAVGVQPWGALPARPPVKCRPE